MTAKRTTKKSPSDAIDEQLKRYRSMRNFGVTSEPAGNGRRKADLEKLPFVIQKHAASHLHYDFRLGWNGVLKSWAIAKGPSYNPSDKRLAVQVEDHPIEYGGFEGIIPQGQYGGGTVMLWDEGTWEPQADHGDVDAGLRNGSLKFTMHGAKMKGNWALVRMNGKAANERKPNWLLIKEHDDFERGGKDAAVVDEAPDSVVTGRSLEEIAKSEDHVWGTKKPATRKVQKSPVQLNLKAYPKERLPQFIPPQLTISADRPPDAAGWVYELKLDGYRIEAYKNGAEVRLLTRTGLDWTHRMPVIATAVGELPVDTAIFDGEVVVFAQDGTASFANLQASFQEGAKYQLTYVVFDLLHVNGHNLRKAQLLERKDLLAQILTAAGESIRYGEHLTNKASTVFEKACELHAEGIISKRAAGSYQSGRTGDWLKVKCAHEQEFVIGGFTLPSNGIHGIGSLLLGYYDSHGKLIYAGRTGTGFTRKIHGMLRDRVEPLRRAKNPFATVPPKFSRDAIWVKPELVAQVNFATWTADNLVRQASFKGLREDKPAKEVRREEAIANVGLPKKAKASHSLAKTRVAKDMRGTQKEKGDHAPLPITHGDKVIDVESGLTKQQLMDYYWAIAEHLLPQIEGRPLSLVRCPEGTGKPCFFQKHTNASLPIGVETIEIADKKTGKPEPYITLSTKEALSGLAQLGVLEIHPWGCKNSDIEHPDRIIIDLDPDASISWQTLATSAEEVRRLFKKLGLDTFLKSTGGKGLHLVAPIAPQHGWPEIKQLMHSIALFLEKQQPSLYLSKMSKAARANRIFVDYLRNERGATAVAAFSPRAREGAPVSMPLAWSELKSSERPLFQIAEFDLWKSRLARDPWKKMQQQKIDLEKCHSILQV